MLHREKKAYYQKNKDIIITRKECCYEYTFLPDKKTIDPKAALWLAHHDKNNIANETFCKQCPTFVLLPALQKLYNKCSCYK